MVLSDKEQIKTDFTPFKVGTVFNRFPRNINLQEKPLHSKVVINYPSRLEAMAIDPSKIAVNDNLHYTPGQIDFTVALFKKISVEVLEGRSDINISERSKRKTLIRHSAELIRSATGFEKGLSIDVEDLVDMRHCGLGSSSGLIAGVACAINELLGTPISDREMVKYLAQNHGEEIDGSEDLINPVQCIGGSAACGTHNGGIIIIAGENIVVKSAIVDENFSVIIGIPENFTYPDSKYLMDKELENMHKFLECGQRYGKEIAYRLFHDCMPALEEGNLKPIGSLIFDYRFLMGSIDNCSFVFPPINSIAKNIERLFLEEKAVVLSLSSVGPGFFAITTNPEECERSFKRFGMKTLHTKIHNGRYLIEELI